MTTMPTSLILELGTTEYERLVAEARRRGVEPSDLARALLGASLVSRRGQSLAEVLEEIHAHTAPLGLDPDQVLDEAYEELREVRRARKARG